MPLVAESADAATDGPATGGGAEAPASQPSTAPKEQRRADVRYNFAPAAAVVGNRYVIATTLDLLHDLIDRLSNVSRAGHADEAGENPAADRVVIDLGETRQILLANRETLVSNRMIEEDVSRAAAERFVDGFLDAFTLGRSISLTAQCGRTDASAKVELVFNPARSSATP
jgi:hypothetical protein